MKKTNFKTAIAASLAAALTLGTVGPVFAQHHEEEQRHEYTHREEMTRGAGPEHNFYVGHRLPPAYHQPTYVVDDWRGHHLRQPPRGYHWVQSGGDYLLVAVASGIIASAILNN